MSQEEEDVTVERVDAVRAGIQCECRVAYAYNSENNEYRMTVELEGVPEAAFVRGDVFQCMCDAREHLRRYDAVLLCNGARLDAYPSRMSRQMSGGLSIYVSSMGQPNGEGSAVPLFGPAPANKIATVEEQKEYHREWLRSLGLDA